MTSHRSWLTLLHPRPHSSRGVMLLVIILTPVSVLLVIDWICYHCCIHHRLELLDMSVDLFIIFGEMGLI
jgi:hypothetical protein